MTAVVNAKGYDIGQFGSRTMKIGKDLYYCPNRSLQLHVLQVNLLFGGSGNECGGIGRLSGFEKDSASEKGINNEGYERQHVDSE